MLRSVLPWVLWIGVIAACRGHDPEDVPEVIQLQVQDPSALKWVAVGDTGLGNRHQHQIARAMKAVCDDRGCDLAMLLGDNLYPRGMQSADDPRMDEVLTHVYKDLGLPMFAVLGNHDWGRGRDEQAAIWQVQWAQQSEIMQMPARYYRLSAGPADLFALDTTPIFWRSDPAQRAWLAESIQASDAPFKVVFGHHAFRSEGRHGNAGDYEGLGWLPIVGGAQLGAMFETLLCEHADLYVAGHDHNLQWLRHCGTELVVSGAGSSTRAIEPRGNRPIFTAATLGFAWISLSLGEDGGRQVEIAFYDNEGRLLHEGSQPLSRAEDLPVQRQSSP